MKCRVSDLVDGQVFRFLGKPTEYVVNRVKGGDINCIKLEDYDKYPSGKRGRCYFTLSNYYMVEIPPYDEIQLSLF